MMNRRNFIQLSCLTGMAYATGNAFNLAYASADKAFIMTVNGKISPLQAGIFLPHEHVVTDFTGAEKVVQPQYNRQEAFDQLLPYLKALKQSGVSVMVECTPAYIGRDVRLLKQLSEESGLHILTNTGYYAAADLKFLPAHAYTESSLQLSARWLKEWKEGIEGTGIRPGFIKLGVGNGPLKPVEQKLVEAAAYTHLKSGLKIAIHTGNAAAVYEELEILNRQGVDAEALIWVHAQSDAEGEAHVEMAKKGCWISLDGINQTAEAIKHYAAQISRLKQEKLLHKVLISHDDGFMVNKKADRVTLDTYQNGNVEPYQSIFKILKPQLLKTGFSEEDFRQMMVINPAEAFKIKVCPVKNATRKG